MIVSEDGIDVDTPATDLGDELATTLPAEVTDRSRRGRRTLRWCRRRWAALLIAALLIASVGAAGGVYWELTRPDQQTDAAVSKRVLDAATQGTVATLSYGVETFDQDLAGAKTHLTGEFLKYYSQFADQFVGPAVKQKQVKTSASVMKAVITELHPDRAVVLLFVNQVTTSTDRPDPALATSSILVTLTKAQNSWLISEFNPV